MTHTQTLSSLGLRLDTLYPHLSGEGDIQWIPKRKLNLQKDIFSIVSGLVRVIPPQPPYEHASCLDDRISNIQCVGSLRRKIHAQLYRYALSQDTGALYDRLMAVLDVNALVKQTLKVLAKEDDVDSAEQKTWKVLKLSKKVDLHHSRAFPIRHVLKYGKLPFLFAYLKFGAQVSGKLDALKLLAQASLAAAPPVNEDIGMSILLAENLAQFSPLALDSRLGIAIDLVRRKRLSAAPARPKCLRIGSGAAVAFYTMDATTGSAALLGCRRGVNYIGGGSSKQGYSATWINVHSGTVSQGIQLVPLAGTELPDQDVEMHNRFSGRGFIGEGIHMAGHKHMPESIIQPLYKTLLWFCDNRQMSLRQKLTVVADIAAALSAMHARDYVHCDISWCNILLNDTGEKAFLTDFGLTHLVDSVPVSLRQQFLSGSGKRTPPEQHEQLCMLEGAGFQGDVYELACLMYGLFFGADLPWAPHFKRYWRIHQAAFNAYNKRQITMEEMKARIKDSPSRKKIIAAQKDIINLNLGVSADTVEGQCRILTLAALHFDPLQRLSAGLIRDKADALLAALDLSTNMQNLDVNGSQ